MPEKTGNAKRENGIQTRQKMAKRHMQNTLGFVGISTASGMANTAIQMPKVIF